MKKFTLIILLLALSMLTACAPTKVTEPTEIKPTTSGSEVPGTEGIVIEYKDNAANEKIQNERDAQRISGPSVGEFTSDRKHNLTIVYFIPSDLKPYADYQRRLSGIMLWAQYWLQKQMNANGFGDKTFGLFTNNEHTNVKLHIVYGTGTQKDYLYDLEDGKSVVGDTNIIRETEAYFAANPGAKTSEHVLYILPSFDLTPEGAPKNGEFGGPPFYGVGKNCFAVDYPEFKIENLKLDPDTVEFATMFGGLVHELGHGLNLGHNIQNISEEADPSKGMSLMFAGNGTLGKTATFLTKIDAAVLNVNQIFNTDSEISYYSPVKAEFTELSVTYDTEKAAIVAQGTFTSDTPVTSLIFLNDPVPNEGDLDYNAIGWETKPTENNTFHFEMPIAELREKAGNMPYIAHLKLVHINGSITEIEFPYTFANGIPQVDYHIYKELPKTDWKVSASSEDTSSENGKASMLIDNDLSTIWMARWQEDPTEYPHTITLTLPEIISADGVMLVQNPEVFRSIKNVAILVSETDDGDDFVEVVTRDLENTAKRQFIAFDSPKNIKRLKIVAKSAWDGEEYAILAEVGLFNK